MSAIDVVMARLKRADDHIEAVHALSDSLIESGLCEFAIENDSKRRRIYLKVSKFDPFPHEYGILIGDAAHNLRAALDNLAFAIVKPPPAKEKVVYFPICDSEVEFLRNAPRVLPGVSTRVRAAFKRLQPYHRRKQPNARYLAQLHVLNNWDKHRQIAVCCALGAVRRMNVQFIGGLNPAGLASHKFMKAGRLKMDTVIASLKLTKGQGETDVKMNPEIILTPAFDQGMPSILHDIEPLRVLINAKWFIEDIVVPELERFL